MKPLVLQSGKRDLVIDPPIMNTFGMLSASGDLARAPAGSLGAIITPALSLQPRTPARPPRFLPFQGGFLLHTGHPNPGLSSTLQTNHSRWQKSPTPIIVHLLAETPNSLIQMVQLLESVESVAGIELGILRMPGKESVELAECATQGELPVLIQLPLNAEDDQILAVAETKPDAFCIGPPRGALPTNLGEVIEGRLYGPFLLPLALQAVRRWTELTAIPIVGGCGIYRVADLTAMLNVGARAIQLDTVLWTRPAEILIAQTE